MSGIAGLFTPDGAPVPADAVRLLIESLRHRGDGAAAVWRDGSVGLGHVLRATTPEAAAENGPHTRIADCRIVFDGRLDNREDLIGLLASDGLAPRDLTDPEIVLAAYLRWDEACAVRLLGDFAFAIWDPRVPRLLCARDILGMRPFCYTHQGTRFAFASEPHALIRAGLASPAVNEGMVGEYLSTTILHKTETLFRDITRLAPAHALVVDRRGLRIARYWAPDPARTIRYRHDREYAEHLRTLLADAVRPRLRANGRVAVMLSGGLDSSAVLGAACSVGARHEIEALTASFPGVPCDETPFSSAMTTAAGVAARVTPADLISSEWLRAQAARYLAVPDAPNGAMFEAIKQDAAARNTRVLLLGCGGDEWFTGSVYRYGDWLREGRLLRIAGQIPLDARVYGWRRAFVLATRVGIWPTMPRRLRLGVRRLLRRQHRTPSWLAPDFARRIDLAERLRWELPCGFRSFAQADTFRTATSAMVIDADEMEDRSAARAGLEQRHPFYDRRLVEFALAIPEDQKCRGVYEKYVLRQAVRPWVPALIRERLGKAEFSDAYVAALRMCGGAEAFRSLRSVERGWVNGARIAAFYREMERLHAARHPRYCWLTDPLWMVLGIELWLSALESDAVAAPRSAMVEPAASRAGRGTHG